MIALWDQDLYVTAWDFASAAHKGQEYNGPVEGEKVDYINHVGSVAMETCWALIAEPGRNGNLAVQCALLHDVIEDTQYTYDDILEQFGEAVADGVLALTKFPQVGDKQAQMRDSLERIKQQPKEVWIVKLADRITNLSPPPWYWKTEKMMRYRDEAQVIHDALGSASNCLAQRLQNKITQYDQYFR